MTRFARFAALVALVLGSLVVITASNAVLELKEAGAHESLLNSSSKHADSPDTEGRVYFLKRVSGPGCPYTASWLSHINLYRKVKYFIDITKMEAATFSIYDKAKQKYQLSDPNAFFVHHMSMYEHLNHKAYGFEVAHNKSITLAQHAVAGECSRLKVNRNRQYIALIPFYGGLPPNVTKDLSVKSIGQGNSLVDASTKALQTLATTCSCLKYFGSVVIGVVRPEDRVLILSMLSKLEGKAKHVNVVQFRLARPAYLPFHLLAWGQHFVRHVNCQAFYSSPSKESDRDGAAANASTIGKEYFGFAEGTVDLRKVPEGQADYEICLPNAITPYSGSPVHVLYMRKPARHTDSSNATVPLRYVYYTECDQVVVFDDMQTLRALSAASNDTTFFTGRRKEKSRDSDPSAYMEGLTMWRECGVAGYSLTWPKPAVVFQDP